jgi:Kyakuja-Dileera-Zisupton transposase
MLACIDGNNSLKRIAWRSPVHDEGESGVNIEREDSRVYQNDYYLTREQVDRFQHEITKTGTTNNGTEVTLISCKF